MSNKKREPSVILKSLKKQRQQVIESKKAEMKLVDTFSTEVKIYGKKSKIKIEIFKPKKSNHYICITPCQSSKCVFGPFTNVIKQKPRYEKLVKGKGLVKTEVPEYSVGIQYSTRGGHHGEYRTYNAYLFMVCKDEQLSDKLFTFLSKYSGKVTDKTKKKGGDRKTLRLDRKGPSESATLFPKGTKKKGNDGNMWVITVTKKGVHRWSKYKSKNTPIKLSPERMARFIGSPDSIKIIDENKLSIKGKKYLIHDNGSRPFLVNINGKDVSIFKLPKSVGEDKDTTKSDYTELVKEYKGVKKVFIGKSPKIEMTIFSGGYGKNFDGNSILVEITDKRYCLISDRIVEFSTKDNITKFVSPVGNNDVPYPLAYGSQNVYVFGLDDHKYIAKETVEGLNIDELFDKYNGTCCPWKSELDKYKKKLKEKLIHKRPGWK